MKIAHDRVIDTSVCFPRRVDRRRERGGGKQSLRFLADNMLNLEIQTAGDDGHDSTEDASTAMRLALLRLRFGFDDVRIHNYARARSRLAAAEEQDAVSTFDTGVGPPGTGSGAPGAGIGAPPGIIQAS